MPGWGSQSRSAKALRCCRIVGLSSSAGAFVGVGISPPTTANVNEANELDLISDPQSARGRVRTVESFHVTRCQGKTPVLKAT
jgi:hypothetical protein